MCRIPTGNFRQATRGRIDSKARGCDGGARESQSKNVGCGHNQHPHTACDAKYAGFVIFKRSSCNHLSSRQLCERSKGRDDHEKRALVQCTQRATQGCPPGATEFISAFCACSEHGAAASTQPSRGLTTTTVKYAIEPFHYAEQHKIRIAMRRNERVIMCDEGGLFRARERRSCGDFTEGTRVDASTTMDLDRAL